VAGELLLWSSLRSFGRQYRACQHRSQDRKQLKALIRTAADQHWTIPQIAEATTLAQSTIRKYIK
jgi:response regulator of citrate/malate metabolism